MSRAPRAFAAFSALMSRSSDGDVDVRNFERSQHLREAIVFLVRQVRRAHGADGAGAFACNPAQPSGDLAQGVVPRAFLQLAVPPEKRPPQPLGAVDEPVVETSLVAHPGFVHGVIAARHRAPDAVAIVVHRDVATV